LNGDVLPKDGMMPALHKQKDWLKTQIEVVGRTYSDIADECGVSAANIHYHAKKMGIATRGLNWAKGTSQRPTCHPDKPHHAHGLCEQCYQSGWRNPVPATCHPDRPHVALGLCAACYQAEQRRRDPEIVRARGRERSAKLRQEMLDAYGNRCTCCGETHQEFLTLEHVYRDGNVHRKRVGAAHIYQDLKRQKWPKNGFTLLCYNCNQSLGHYGYCPHQTKA
jgi:hypothetical protein